MALYFLSCIKANINFCQGRLLECVNDLYKK